MLGPITLTTDFGSRDGYVGVLKGVIARVAGHALIIDITHEIGSGDIRQGSWILANSYRYFPSGSIHVGIVDPGVGSQRRAVLIQGPEHSFIGPDNGLFSNVIAEPGEWRVFVLDKSEFWLPQVSTTFHGRDIFAPVAAHIASGRKANEIGTEVGLETLVRFRAPEMARIGDQVVGKVVHVDKFGNLITNIPGVEIKNATSCVVENIEIPIGLTYSSAEPGHAVAYAGSHGYVEVGVCNGRADQHLEAERDAKVTLLCKKC